MRNIKDWFTDYAVSHKNEKNIKIHIICVPLIYYALIGLFMKIPIGFINYILPDIHFILKNWATFLLIPIFLFYVRLSIKIALQVSLFHLICVFINFYTSIYINLLFSSIIIFTLGWVGQFYGHKIEGKKPSFIEDLQFLLIGPAWVIHKIFRGKL